MRVQLILEAIDRASAVIGKVTDAVGRANTLTVEQAKAGVKSAMLGVAGAAAASATVAAPIMKAANAWNTYEDSLTDVGLKAELSGAKLAALGERIRSQSRALNMNSVELLGGMNKLMEGGLNATAAEAALSSVAKAAIATKTSVSDLGELTVAMINNGKIAAGEVGRALSVLAQTGKDGNAELNRMVSYLPRLTSQFATMGRSGVPAVADIGAAFQVVNGVVNNMEGSAAGIRDLMNKITADKAVKAFSEAGIDINKVMKDAIAAGRPLDAILETLQKFAGTDLTKINEIFGDVQAQQAARALLQNLERFEDIRKRAMNSGDVIGLDFLTRMGLGVEKARALEVAMSELWTTLGKALAPMVGEKIDQIISLVNTIERWIAANPELAASIAKTATTVAALMVGVAGLKLAFAVLRLGGAIGAFRLLTNVVRLALLPLGMIGAFLRGAGQGAAAAVAAFGGWRVVLAALGSRLMWLITGPFALLRSAFMAIGAAMMATPIGWIVAGLIAVGTAAYFIYQNWERLGPMLTQVWDGLVAKLDAVWTAIKTGAAQAWESIKATISAGIDGLLDPFATLGTRLTTALGTAWSSVTGWVSGLSWPSLPDFGSLVAGLDPLATIKARLERVIGWIEGWGKRLFEIFSGAIGKVRDFVSGALDTIGAGFEKIGGFVSRVGDFFSSGPKVADPATLQASIDKAREYERVVTAIAPAARQAVSQASAVLAAANFHSHGVRMMETLAAGIRAGSNAAVAAVRDTVQRIRDHLPHSPAKTGPLSDLHRVQFSETLAGAIERGSPRALGAARVLAAGLAASVATTPAFAGARPGGASAGGGSASGGGSITVNLTLSPNFRGGTPEDFISQLRAALPDVAHELAQAMQGETGRRARADF